jgi:ubiquinone/menaquinone biosynthesis C-methylase UbiE
MLTPTRITADELLDAHDAPRADVERSLRDLDRINRYLGGNAIYRDLASRFAPRSILDLGTGTSKLLDEMTEVPLRVGLDFKIDHLLFSRNGSRVLRVVGDAKRLPFRDGAVDVVTSAHFFHHFSPEENAGILAESMRVARRGVAVNDTQRHYFPLLFTILLGVLRLVGRITRYDAPASVRQAYTIDEARAIADGVPAAKREIVRGWPFRLGILLWK